MDNFDNFYNNDDDDNKKNTSTPEPAPRVIFQSIEPSAPEPKHKKLKKTNIALTVITIVLALAFIANIVVMSVLKDEIAKKFATDMSHQAQLEYKDALDNVLNNTGIIDDVKDAAASTAIDRLNTDIGANIAAASLNSVMIIKCSTANNSSTATGFLISNNGTRYVLTNEHVVMYETTVSDGGLWGTTRKEKVAFSNIKTKFYNSTTEYSMKVVAHDSDVDLALLRFESAVPSATTHPALKLATSPDVLSYGEEVLIIGNPEGIGIACAKGTVSIPSLTVESWGSSSFIMTDAAVNPGNSGGPMLDRNGTCVGVVQSKLVSSNIDNMGFAIAIDTVIEFLKATEQVAGITISYILA